MPATFKPELKHPARQDKTHAVRIRITKFRKHSYYNVGKYVQVGEWNPKPKRNLKNWVIKHKEAAHYNAAIHKALAELEQVADQLPAATAGGIKEAYERARNPEAEKAGFRSFFDFAEEYVQRLKDRNYKTGFDMAYRLPEFKAIVGEKTTIEEMFSARLLHKFVQSLKAKGNSPQTIKNKLRDIRTLYNAGVKEKQFPDLGSPFAEIKVTVPKKKRDRPTAAQLQQFINYEPKNEVQAMAKTVALLQYLLLGARVGEALTLQWSNVQEAYIEYLPQKQAVKPKFVPRSPMLNQLLDSQPTGTRFVLPYLGEDFQDLSQQKKHSRKKRVVALINKGLTEIAEALKFKIDLTSHMFRHAFADALIAAGANPHTAAAMLGHANPKTSEVYFKDLVLGDISGLALTVLNKLEGNTGEQ